MGGAGSLLNRTPKVEELTKVIDEYSKLRTIGDLSVEETYFIMSQRFSQSRPSSRATAVENYEREDFIPTPSIKINNTPIDIQKSKIISSDYSSEANIIERFDAIQVGQLIPPFSLITSDMKAFHFPNVKSNIQTSNHIFGKNVDFNKNTLFIILPTIYCSELFTSEGFLMILSKHFTDIERGKHLDVVSISSDLPQALHAAKKRFTIPFTMVSDPSLLITQLFTPLINIGKMITKSILHSTNDSSDTDDEFEPYTATEIEQFASHPQNHLHVGAIAMFLVNPDCEVLQRWSMTSLQTMTKDNCVESEHFQGQFPTEFHSEWLQVSEKHYLQRVGKQPSSSLEVLSNHQRRKHQSTLLTQQQQKLLQEQHQQQQQQQQQPRNLKRESRQQRKQSTAVFESVDIDGTTELSMPVLTSGIQVKPRVSFGDIPGDDHDDDDDNDDDDDSDTENDLQIQVKKPHALVIENHGNTASMVCKLLHQNQYETSVVNNGEIALRLLKYHPHEYQLILCNVFMPVCDGISFLTQLKTGEKHKYNILSSTTIVMYSNYEDRDSYAPKCLNLGAKAVLKLPFTFKDLQPHLL